MGDPLSVTASVIAVSGLACSSVKTLKEAISGLLNAPEVLRDCGTDLGILQNLLQALQQPLHRVPNADLSTNQKAYFESLKPALSSCKEMCDDFGLKLSKVTSHSQADKVNWWDRARLYFNEEDIALLKSNLEENKQTFDMAIGVATLSSVSHDREALHELETKIATSVNTFAGQIIGLDTALQSISVVNAAIGPEDVQNVAKVLKEHGRVLKLCYESCMSGLKDTNAKSGTQVRSAKTFNEAKQAIGTMGNVTGGGPPTIVEYAEARDKSMQHIGPMDTESAKAFWTSK